MSNLSVSVVHFSAEILPDYYLFSHSHVSKRSTDPHPSTHDAVVSHPEVEWAEQQKVLSRKKRQLWRIPPPPPQANEKFEDFMHFNDARYK